MKLSDALTKYIAWGKYKNKQSSMSTYYTHIRLLCVHFKNCEIEDIKIHQIIEYMDLMKTMGWDDNGFIPKCNAWKQFFRYWESDGLKVLDASTIPVPTIDYRIPKALELADFNKLMKALDKHRPNILKTRNIAALRFLFDTGCRVNEFLSVKTTNLDLTQMRTVIQTEKSRGVKPVRMVFWTKETNQALKEYVAAKVEFLKQKKFEDKGWLWVHGHGTWNCGDKWSDTGVETVLKRLSKEANLGFTANPHKFRHHFGRNLAIKGANNSVISDMMGHANIESTRIYTVMNEHMMQDIYNKMVKKK